MTYSRYEALKKRLRSDLSLQKAEAKTAFAVDIWRSMEDRGISKAQLAEKLGKSAPWVTKVLTGDCNFTIETMVELAEAVGAGLTLRVERADAMQSRIEVPRRNAVQPRGFCNAMTFSAHDETIERRFYLRDHAPSNHESYRDEDLAAA